VAYDSYNETMIIVPTSSGTHDYVYQYINNYGSNGCVFDTTLTVTVRPEIEALFPDNKTICEGESTDLVVDIVEAYGNPLVQWFNQDSMLVATGTNYNVSPNDTSLYYINVQDECN